MSGTKYNLGILLALILAPTLFQRSVIALRPGSSQVVSQLSGISVGFSQLHLTERELGTLAQYRFNLLAGLDLLVRLQRDFRFRNHTYSRALEVIPGALGNTAHFYDVEILQANRESLKIVARAKSEAFERMPMPENLRSLLLQDIVWIDQNFNVEANFELPEPPRGYLIQVALGVLRELDNNPSKIETPSYIRQLEGIFHGYFRYDLRNLSAGANALGQYWKVLASGVRAPMEAETIQLADNGWNEGGGIFSWIKNYREKNLIDQELHFRIGQLQRAELFYQKMNGKFSDQLQDLIQIDPDLVALMPSEFQRIELRSIQLDDKLSYQAEFSFAQRSWLVNRFLQITEVRDIEDLVSSFDRARRKVAAHGSIGRDLEFEEVDRKERSE